MDFVQLTEEEFDAFSKRQVDANFWQSIDMAHLRKWNGWSYEYVGVKDHNGLIAATMLSYRVVFLKSTFVQAVRGFYIDYHNKELLTFFQQELEKHLKKRNCMYFKIDPYLPYKERDINGDLVKDGFDHQNIVDTFLSFGYNHAGFLRGNDVSREPNWMFVSDLKDKNEATLLKEFDHQTRWSINKTLKIGILIEEATIDDLVEFKQIMEHTSNRRGFKDHDMHYYEGLFKTFGKSGNLKALFAKLDVQAYIKNMETENAEAMEELADIEKMLEEVTASKKYNKKKRVVEEQIALLDKKLVEADELHKQGDVITLAAATFIRFGHEMMYLYSGAYEDYMKFNGPYALQWYILRYCLDNGITRYNFYGISGIFERDAEDYGIYEFKKGFNGHVEELIGDFYLITQPIKYHVYEGLRKVKHFIKR